MGRQFTDEQKVAIGVCFNPLAGISYGQTYPPGYSVHNLKQVSIPLRGLAMGRPNGTKKETDDDFRFNPLAGISYGQTDWAVNNEPPTLVFQSPCGD